MNTDNRTATSPKERLRQGEAFNVPYASIYEDRDGLVERYRKEQADMAFVDLQHAPFDDRTLIDFCAWSSEQNVPVLLRIAHPAEVHTIGRYCDFGAAGIIVPITENAETARAAVANFYYPPIGERSWGPGHAWGNSGGRYGEFKGFEYAQWWHENGILALQIESVNAVAHCHELAADGVDLLCFGSADLTLSVTNTPSPWKDAKECIAHVRERLADLPVRVSPTDIPFGHFPEDR